MTVADHRALLEHIGFISHRATTDDFKDSAHTDYDSAIRKQAESCGFAAFSKANTGTSVTYYSVQSMKVKWHTKGEYSGRRFSTASVGLPAGKRVCYRWNSDVGCFRSDEDCIFGHFCAKRGAKGHHRQKCKD